MENSITQLSAERAEVSSLQRADELLPEGIAEVISSLFGATLHLQKKTVTPTSSASRKAAANTGSVSALGTTLSMHSAWKLSSKVNYAANLDDLYRVSDFLTIHVPYMESTKHMINAEGIAKMRDGVAFLNFARDALVDEDAMAEALASGKVRTYVTDFPNEKTVKMKNAVVLPHIGASTEEAEENCAVMAVKEMQDYLDNGNITHSVNYPDLNAGICQSAARVAILHRNIPNMLSQITAFFGKNGLNIENLSSKVKGDYEYTLLDLSSPMPEDTEERLREIPEVLRVRQIL